MNYQNYQNLMILTSSDTKRTSLMHFFVYKFRLERTGFNMYAEYTQLQLTFLAIVPWYILYRVDQQDWRIYSKSYIPSLKK